MRKIFTILLGVVFLTSCSRVSFSVGEEVLAEWYQNSWHKGKLLSACGEGEAAGFHVDFEDNFYDAPEGESEVCYIKKDSIIKNKAPLEADLSIDMKVLGEWVADAFYNATITKIENGKYMLKYEDDYTQEVDIQKIRLLPEGSVEEAKK